MDCRGQIRTRIAGHGYGRGSQDMDCRTWIAGQGLQDMDTDMNSRTWIRTWIAGQGIQKSPVHRLTD